MLKKVIIFAILSAMMFSSFSLFSTAYEIGNSNYTAEGHYLYDLSHNIIISQENTNKSISPSSTAKIMTACIVLESDISLNQEVQITASMLNNVYGRTMSLKEGDMLTIEDLLHATICGGYNDATHILALTIAPTIYKFTELMNEKAIQLGMKDTHYTNPTGIESPNMITTINDIAKLVKYVAQSDLFLKITSTKQYKLSNQSVCEYKTITNRSSLLSKYKGISNFNLGSGNSGDCSVVFYKTDNSALISIVMNAKSTIPSNKNNYAEIYNDSLLSYAINNYKTHTLKTTSDIITSLPVKYSTSSQEINIYLQEDLKVFGPKDIDIENDISYSININNEELSAPLKVGDVVGVLMVFNNGVLIAQAPLIILENIDKNTFLYYMDMIKQFVLSKTFIIALIIFITSIIYCRTNKKHQFKKRKRKRKRKTRKKPT